MAFLSADCTSAVSTVSAEQLQTKTNWEIDELKILPSYQFFFCWINFFIQTFHIQSEIIFFVINLCTKLFSSYYIVCMKGKNKTDVTINYLASPFHAPNTTLSIFKYVNLILKINPTWCVSERNWPESTAF